MEKYSLCKVTGIKDALNVLDCKKYAFEDENRRKFLIDSGDNKNIFMELVIEDASFLNVISTELKNAKDRVYHTVALNILERLLGFLEESEDFIPWIRNFDTRLTDSSPHKLIKFFYMLVVYKKLIWFKENEGRQNTLNKEICYSYIYTCVGEKGIDVCRQSLGLDVVTNESGYGNYGYYAPNGDRFVEGMTDHSISNITRNNRISDSMFTDDEEELNKIPSLITNFLE